MTAANKIDRPEDPLFNLDSGIGGALDVAAMFAEATITLDTDIEIKDGAALTQLDTRDADDIFQIGLTTDVIFSDRQNLDSSGVLPFPFGDSFIDVKAGDAKINLGNIRITTLGLLDIYAGGNSDIRSEVHTSANGLAGVPGALAVANYDAGHMIELSEATRLLSDDKVSLRAGNVASGLQSLKVQAEARAFNRTALPIVDEPEGRVSVTTRSAVVVPDGATVIATGDIDVFADAGLRDNEGFAKGTDLYRGIRDGLNELFNADIEGDPVAIESGDRVTVDTSTDIITVNGLLRAGAKNKRVLAINAAGVVDNTLLGFTDKEAEGIEIARTANVSLSQNIQAQINVLDAQLADSGLNSDEAAVATWTAERRILIQRLATARGISAPQIEIGNIALRADNVLGTNTGQITAPGDALIDIRVAQNAFLVINDLTIPTIEGGIVTFNNTVVANAGDVRDQAASNLGLAGTFLPEQGFNITSGANTGAPEITVSTTGDKAAITVEGTISNLRGTARVISNNSDLEIRGSVQALTPILSAPNGNFFLFADPGIAFVGPDPRAQYKTTYFDRVHNAVRDAAHDSRLNSVNGTTVSQSPKPPLLGIEFVSTGLSAFHPVANADGSAEDRGSVLGRNVFITGDQLNINGLVEAGRFQFDVLIGAGVDTRIAELIAAGGDGTTILSSPDRFGVGTVVNNRNIISDVTVAWNNQTKRIEIADMVTQGGVVDITGRISSTGGGEIRSLDGFGTAKVGSDSRHPIQLSRIDTGQTINGTNGVRGVVRITDLNQPLGGGRFLTTEYRRLQGDANVAPVVRVLSNRSSRIETDEFGNRIEVPQTFEGNFSAKDGRAASFAPVGQDFVVVQTESRTRTTTETKSTRFDSIFGSRDPVESSTSTFSTPIDTTALLKNAPYIELNSDADRAGYRMDSQLFDFDLVVGDLTVLSDTRTLGFGTVVTEQISTTDTSVRYSHKIRADLPIAITFAGANADGINGDGVNVGGINVSAIGDVVLSDQIINFGAQTAINSNTGGIVALTDLASLRTADTALLAFGGPIGGLTPGDTTLKSIDRALRLDQVEGAQISALSFEGGINLHETKGSMLIGSIVAANFDGSDIDEGFAIDLTAQGSIRQTEDAGAVIGSELTLEAQTGSIGGSTLANPFLNVGIVGGGITALANGDVQLQAIGLDLPVREITSRTGRIVLRTEEGAIIDANPIERKDLRTEAELVRLWTDELGLVGEGNAARRLQRAIDAELESERALNHQFWADRLAAAKADGVDVGDNGDGAPAIAFVEDVNLKQGLLNAGMSDAEYATFLTERQARHAEWNAQVTFDAGYAPTLSADKVAELSDGIEWQLSELQRTIDLALVTRSASTQIRDEDPNLIAAGDIALTSEQSIGIALPEARILGDGDTILTGADLALLSAAEISDVRIADGSVFVAQRDDLNVTFTGLNPDGTVTGSLAALARAGDLLISTRGAMDIELAASNGLTLLRADGLLSNRGGRFGVTGSRIVLESGGTAGIGLQSQPIRVNLSNDGTLAARGAGDIHIAAQESDIALEGIFATGRVTLGASGAITDAFDTGAPRIISDGLTILGGSLGTSDRFLKYETTGDASSVILSDGDAFVETDADMNLTLAAIEGSGELRSTGKINLIGTTETAGRVILGDTSVVVLNAPGGLSATNTRFSDIDGGNIQLRLGGPIVATRGRLETSVNRLDFASTAAEGVDTALRVSNEGALELSVVQNLAEGSVTFVEATGDLSPDLVLTPQLVDLFSRDGAIVGGGINAPTVALRGATGVGTGDLRIAARTLTAFTSDGDIKATLFGANGLEALPVITLQSIVAAGRGNIELTSSASGITVGRGGFVSAADGTVSLVAQNLDFARGAQVASIKDGDVRLQALGNIAMDELSLINALDGQVRIRAGGDLDMTRVLAGGNEPGAININVGGALRLVGDTDLPRLVATGGSAAGATVTAGSLNATLFTDLRTLSADIRSGAVRVANLGDLDIGRIVAGNGDITVTTERDLTPGDIFAPGNVATLSGRDILPGAGIFDTAVAFVQAREGDIAGLDVASDGRTLFNLDAARDINITETEGDLLIGAANAGRTITVFAASGALLKGAFQNAELINLFTRDGVGTLERAAIAGGRVNAASDTGDVNLSLFTGAMPSLMGDISALGRGDISIEALVPRAVLAADGQITSFAGDIRITAQDLALNGGVSSAGGDIILSTTGNLTMDPGSSILSSFGRAILNVDGDLELAQVLAGAEGLRAVAIDVKGALSVADGVVGPNILSADGATLLIAHLTEGASQVNTDVARADMIAIEGDLGLQNVSDLDLVRAVSRNGIVRVAAGGEMRVRTAQAGAGQSVTLVAANDLFGEATLSDGPLTLISQDGAIDLNILGDADLALAQTRFGTIRIESTGTMAVGTAQAAENADLILAGRAGLISRGDGAQLIGGRIELLGRDGSVGTTDRAFAMTGPSAASVEIDGKTGINVAAAQVNLTLALATSTDGNVTVRNTGTLSIGDVRLAPDGIGVLDGAQLVSNPAKLTGGQFDLIARSGGIGSDEASFTVETSDGAVLNLTAAGDIAVAERSGNLTVGTATGTGLVRVEVNRGALTGGTFAGGTRVQLGAANGVGTVTAARILGGTAEAIADAGDINLVLAAGVAPVGLGQVRSAGTGNISIDALTQDVTLEDAGSITSAAGDRP
ncbi:hypothetical protein OO012_02690 [Rhodobacteraceae bacterium KMM 6894]|nr:hypothetical protein [Rhodobacteraceae bacterium KMM 6894]